MVEIDPLTGRPIRSTPEFFLTYSVILPFSVKPQATSKGCGIKLGTPRNGTMLGCCNLLHTMTPPKKVYDPGASASVASDKQQTDKHCS